MIPDDVRTFMRVMADWYMDEEGAPEPSGQMANAVATLAWLDAQPAAPEPDWTQAPEWAQWWAVQASGFAKWYQDKPAIEWGDWRVPWNMFTQSAGDANLPLGSDWRMTLRRRPEVEVK